MFLSVHVAMRRNFTRFRHVIWDFETRGRSRGAVRTGKSGHFSTSPCQSTAAVGRSPTFSSCGRTRGPRSIQDSSCETLVSTVDTFSASVPVLSDEISGFPRGRSDSDPEVGAVVLSRKCAQSMLRLLRRLHVEIWTLSP